MENNNNLSAINKTSTIAIILAAVLFITFFLPLVKFDGFLGFSASSYDIVFSNISRRIGLTENRFFIVLIPVSALLIIINEATKGTLAGLASILKFVPIITWVILLLITFAKLDDIGRNIVQPNDLLNFLGIGFWLSIIISIILPFMNLTLSNQQYSKTISNYKVEHSFDERKEIKQSKEDFFEKLKSTEKVNSNNTNSKQETTVIQHDNKIEQLKQLKKLLDQGILTIEEFNQQKSQIL